MRACCLILFLAGCTPSPAPDAAPSPFAGQAVTISVPEGLGYREAWEASANDWAAQTGAQVQIEEYAAGDTLPGQSGGLVVFPVTQLARWVEADQLSPLAAAGSTTDVGPSENSAAAGVPGLGWEEAWLGLREKIGSPGGKPCVFPVCTPTLVLYYRADLLSKAKLQPPQTWDEYHALVSTLADWAPGKIVAEPWGEEFRATMFLARAVSAAQHPGHHAAFFDVETLSPLIANAAYGRTLEQASQFLRSVSDENREFLWKSTPAACRQELLAGRAALAIAWEDGATPFTPGRTTVKPGPRAENISLGMVRLPGVREIFNPSRGTWDPAPNSEVHHVSLAGFGGLVAAVRKSADGKTSDAAWHLAGRLWNVDSPGPQPPGTFAPFREGDIVDVSRFVGQDLESGEAQAYALAVADSLRDRRLVVELPLPGREEYRAALTKGLTRALAAGDEAARHQALTAVAGQWREITDRLGRDKVRAVYRRFLSLDAP